jgi:hypothetical protein
VGGQCSPSDVHEFKDLKNWLLDWLARVREAFMDISLMVIYQMWLARNDARESKIIENPESIALRSIKLMEEWHGLNDTKPTKVQALKERWSPPAEGWVKVNSDGAMAKSAMNGGGGVVICDHDGRFLAGSPQFSPPYLILRRPSSGRVNRG